MPHLQNCFARDSHGSVVIVFALSIFVLFGVVGAAVDFARTQSSRDALQQDLDAAILFITSEKTKRGATFDEQAGMQSYMDGLKRQKQIYGKVDISVTKQTDTRFRVAGRATVLTPLMGILGVKSLPINVTSEAQVASERVEIALVLDNTLSMAGPKIAALKVAAKNLIDSAFASPAGHNVKLGIVPFSAYVNVGLSNRYASWMDVPPDTSSVTNVCRDVRPATAVPGSCREESYAYTADGVPKIGIGTRCDYTYGEPVRQCSDQTTASTWHGCAGSRSYPLNVTDAEYAAKVPGAMNVRCPSELTPLTNDQPTVNAAIEQMVATGDTYIPAGLMWGWAALSKHQPYDQAQVSARKIMVLMTDGFNTLSVGGAGGAYHNGNNRVEANRYTSEICANIKADKIEVYTVAFEVTDPEVKQILENCASQESQYFDAANGSDLEKAFEQIAADFAPLYLTR